MDPCESGVVNMTYRLENLERNLTLYDQQINIIFVVITTMLLTMLVVILYKLYRCWQALGVVYIKTLITREDLIADELFITRPTMVFYKTRDLQVLITVVRLKNVADTVAHFNVFDGYRTTRVSLVPNEHITINPLDLYFGFTQPNDLVLQGFTSSPSIIVEVLRTCKVYDGFGLLLDQAIIKDSECKIASDSRATKMFLKGNFAPQYTVYLPFMYFKGYPTIFHRDGDSYVPTRKLKTTQGVVKFNTSYALLGGLSEIMALNEKLESAMCQIRKHSE